MRLTLFAAMLALPMLAQAQTNTQTPPPGGSAFTPAPVPSVPPSTSQTDGAVAPAERIAPPGTGTADQTDTSLPNASPLSGPPSSLNPGTNQAAPRGSSVDPVTPSQSR